MNRVKVILISLLVLHLNLNAGATDGFKDTIQPLLKSDAQFLKDLQDSFDISDNVWADIRLGNHTNFGGARLGDYYCYAKPKGSKNKWSLLLVFKTNYYGLDKDGKKVEVIDPSAVKFIEEFTNLEVKALKEELK